MPELLNDILTGVRLCDQWHVELRVNGRRSHDGEQYDCGMASSWLSGRTY